MDPKSRNGLFERVIIMKCCAFGTVRIDIHIYQGIGDIEQYEEIKINEMNLAVGGSVYNTVCVLNELRQDIVFYMPNSVDEFADLIKNKMNQRNIHHVTCKEDRNDTAVSLIFIDESGNKKMISYDGIRQDKYVLNRLLKEIEQYDLFYTSFYEINQNNYHDIFHIMSQCERNFVDLCPMIYKVDKDIIDLVLQQSQILSGTEDEYAIILKKLDCNSMDELIEKYRIEQVFVKKGAKGAMVLTQNNKYEHEPRKRKASHDTTGCGDTFNAGIIDSFTKKANNERMLQQAVEMATKVAYAGLKEGLFEI
jgi:sugar/nucleoside kinase (ribokinase family)